MLLGCMFHCLIGHTLSVLECHHCHTDGHQNTNSTVWLYLGRQTWENEFWYSSVKINGTFFLSDLSKDLIFLRNIHFL